MKQSIENPIDIVQQCTMCNSEGETMIDEKRLENIYKDHVKHEQKKDWINLKREHVQKLEFEIQNLMKQKAMLQDKINEMESANE